MESFAVKCTCPEVTDILLQLAGKKGWDTTCSLCIPVSKVKWLRFGHVPGFSGECGRSDAVEYRDTWNRGALPIYSIEAAIAELSKPRHKPLMVGAHRVTVNPDRSVTVGCTTVPADVCDEIERRRGKAEAVEPPQYEYSIGSLSGLLYRCRDARLQDWVLKRGWKDRSSSGVSISPITEAEARQRFPEAFTETK